MVSSAPSSAEQSANDYLVRLSSFQGPLDLLLWLIRRAEVDIRDIPIAAITDQYLGFVRADLQHVDMEEAGEFLVMAATLVQIKARTLAPRPAPQEGDADGAVPRREQSDPRAELIHALLAYQRYRSAGEWLEARRGDFSRRRALRAVGGREPEPELSTEPTDGAEDLGPPAALEIEDLHLLDLSEAYERIVGSIDFSRLGDHRLVDDDTPIAIHQEDLLERLGSSADGRLDFQSVLAGRTRLEKVGLFLAMLELAKQQRLEIDGDDLERELVLRLSAGDEGARRD